MTDHPHNPAAARPRITVAEVRASFNRKIKDHLTLTWFARPIADLWTPFFFNRGWSANQVTLVKGVIYCLTLILLGTGRWEAHIAAVAAFYVGYVLDCVDGNLARLNDSASYWGKFADGLSDFIFVGFAPLAAGIGLWIQEGNATALLVGAVTTAVTLGTEFVRHRFSFFREWMVSQTGPLTDRDDVSRDLSVRLEKTMTEMWLNGRFLAPLLLLFPHGASYYVFALVVVQGVPCVVRLAAILHQARAILGRYRKSIHSAPEPRPGEAPGPGASG